MRVFFPIPADWTSPKVYLNSFRISPSGVDAGVDFHIADDDDSQAPGRIAIRHAVVGVQISCHQTHRVAGAALDLVDLVSAGEQS